MNPYALRPYHNPENIDESKVPSGWRFRYADESGTKVLTSCKAWLGFMDASWGSDGYEGTDNVITYIVPV